MWVGLVSVLSEKKKNTQNLGFCTSGSQLAKNAQIL